MLVTALTFQSRATGELISSRWTACRPNGRGEVNLQGYAPWAHMGIHGYTSGRMGHNVGEQSASEPAVRAPGETKNKSSDEAAVCFIPF